MAQQTVNLGSAPDAGDGDTLRAGGDKINDNFDELYDETLKFKGSTDCSANPNYPTAPKGDAYRVSVAGKIGGASGVDVEAGDLYFATADNAGGTQAAVGTSWTVLQGNTIGGGSGIDVEDEGVPEATGATTLNFVGAGVVAADMGGGVVDVTIAGGGSGVDVEDEGVAETTGATTLNFTGAGVTATDAGAGQCDIDIPGGGSGWALAGTSWAATGVWDQAVDGSQAAVGFTGLAGAKDIMVMSYGTVRGTTGQDSLQVSTDNGSTWFTTSGDYISIDSAGASSNLTGHRLFDTNATAARYGTGIIHAANLSGVQKNMETISRGPAGRHSIFIASTSAINAVRIVPSGGGNLTGGKIYCFTR